MSHLVPLRLGKATGLPAPPGMSLSVPSHSWTRVGPSQSLLGREITVGREERAAGKATNRFIWDPCSAQGCPFSPGWCHCALLARGQHGARRSGRQAGYSSAASARLPQARPARSSSSLRSPPGLGEPPEGCWQVWVMSWKVRPKGQDVQLLAKAPRQV